MPNIISKIETFELPGQNPCGLSADGTFLWISDLEVGTIYQIDPDTAAVVDQFQSFVKRPILICRDEKYLWQYDEESMMLFRTDCDVNEDFPFGSVSPVNLPLYGLASDGKSLWLLSPDYPYFPIQKTVITRLDATWKLHEKSFDAPSHGSRGLCFDGGNLWTLDNAKSEIYVVDSDTGMVINTIYVPEIPMSGLAKIGDRLWSIDYRERKLCRYTLDETVRYSVYHPRRSLIKMTETLKNHGPGIVRKWETCFPIPRDYLNQELIGEVRFSEKPHSYLSTSWGQGTGKAAKFVFEDLQPGHCRGVTMSFEIATWDVRYHLYPDKVAGLEAVPDAIRDAYVTEDIEKKSPETREILQKLNTLFQVDERIVKRVVEETLGDEKHPYWVARKLYDYVIDKVEYVLPYRHIPCSTIVEDKQGSCTNQAHLYVALCLAAGLPARYLAGYTVWREDSRFGYINHSIPEVYIPGFDWIPVDTTQFMFLPAFEESPSYRAKAFGSLSNRFFVSEIRGDYDSEYQRWSFLATDKVMLESQSDLGEDSVIDWRFVE